MDSGASTGNTRGEEGEGGPVMSFSVQRGGRLEWHDTSVELLGRHLRRTETEHLKVVLVRTEEAATLLRREVKRLSEYHDKVLQELNGRKELEREEEELEPQKNELEPQKNEQHESAIKREAETEDADQEAKMQNLLIAQENLAKVDAEFKSLTRTSLANGIAADEVVRLLMEEGLCTNRDARKIVDEVLGEQTSRAIKRKAGSHE
ncbi:hypothetical protein B484DRAFT_460555 [Ochromonadaceae sp. CCMP2298]|nr:hypothetical protein B484DRAFT_460555 [Ochromonadaceae sp. CCMP2298]